MVKHGPNDGCTCGNCQVLNRLIKEVEQQWKTECDCNGGGPAITHSTGGSSWCGHCGKWIFVNGGCGNNGKHKIERKNNDHSYNERECRERERERERDKTDTKKYGSDYPTLKPNQQEGRKTTHNKWEIKRKKNISYRKCCRYCPQEFAYDTNLQYLSSQTKAEQQLTVHENICSHKHNQTEQQRLKQEKWDSNRAKKELPFYRCQQCWGKVLLDKDINNWTDAKKQALADLAYHGKQECGHNLSKPKIAIYFSPNQGGNQHADLTYANQVNENDLIMEISNDVYQQEEITKPTSYLPWILGGIGIVIVIIGLVWLVRRNKREK